MNPTKRQIDALIKRFNKNENVRIRAEAEQENYFDVYGEPDSAEERADIIHQLDTYGLWYVVGERKCPACGQWETVDGVGMCMGYNDPTNPHENVYAYDIMDATLEAEKAGRGNK